MCQLRVIFPLVCVLGFAACDVDETLDATGDASVSQPVAELGEDDLTRGSIGQVDYRFDAQRLTRAEIDLALPPDFEATTFAVKFIPAELSGNIGTEGCSYGKSADNDECTADEEVGIALALLERPIAHYRDTFDDSDPADGSFDEDIILAGHRGFALSQNGAKTRMRFTFLPVEGRTLLVAERTEEGVDAGTEALREMRNSITY